MMKPFQKFKAIACINHIGTLGDGGALLYNIPDDMTNFKSRTTGNVIIMGRKTFESLPQSKPLKNRVNIILTSDKSYNITVDNSFNGEVYIAHSIEDVVELCDTLYEDKEWFVIGGESIFEAFFDHGLINECCLTVVHEKKEGDAYFPLSGLTTMRSYFKTPEIKFNDLEYHFETFKI